MNLIVTVERRDGTREEYPVYPSAIVAFEREVKMGLAQAFADSNVARNENAYKLAYLCQKDSGAVVKMFDEWLKSVADVEIGENPKG